MAIKQPLFIDHFTGTTSFSFTHFYCEKSSELRNVKFNSLDSFITKKPVFDFEISSSLSFDNIFHHLNQVFSYFQLISLNHHLDSLVHTTIKSLPPFISTISTRFLLHLNHQSSIQHHPTHYLVTTSVLSSIILHLHLFPLSF